MTTGKMVSFHVPPADQISTSVDKVGGSPPLTTHHHQRIRARELRERRWLDYLSAARS
jgi:hypothetical protein